uniref:NEDD8-activating enzyme E1 regulatory subunit n=2 Tax=Hirondellea gigas TaxID=1518452 RepID=A0A2P2I2D0_9CRUS
MDSKPATPLSEQSDKTKKYDRQLRLWGDHGQALLEAAHVCVCGASAATTNTTDLSLGGSSVLGAEVLRSLVLPGVGKITIIDDATVTEADLGTNLLVNADGVGGARGEQLLQCLLEMNTDVRGSFVDQSVEDVLASDPSFFDAFTIVVAVNMHEKTLLELSDVLWRAKVPLIAVRSYGLIGYIRIQVEEQTIIESHPDNEIADLRLLDPFPALKEHFDSIELESMSDKDHSHVPYVIVVYKFLQQWIHVHGGPPANYREKKSFALMIRDGMRHKTASDFEENFEEAMKAVNTCLSGCSVPSSLEELFSLVPSPLTPSTPPFWLALAGLQTFVTSNKRLPVTGALPDMTADSVSYIKLQNIYREQAAQDCEAVLRHSLDTSQQVSSCGVRSAYSDCKPLSDKGSNVGVTESLVKNVCRNAAHLRVLRGTSIAQEYSHKINLACNDIEQCDSDVVWYVLLRAVDLFYSEFHCFPGCYKQQVETDIVRLKVCLSRLLSEWTSGSISVKDDHIHEMCRYGAAQIHSVASFIGGCAAHEIIKIITSQYVPLDNTFIYNAATASTTTLTL